MATYHQFLRRAALENVIKAIDSGLLLGNYFSIRGKEEDVDGKAYRREIIAKANDVPPECPERWNKYQATVIYDRYVVTELSDSYWMRGEMIRSDRQSEIQRLVEESDSAWFDSREDAENWISEKTAHKSFLSHSIEMPYVVEKFDLPEWFFFFFHEDGSPRWDDTYDPAYDVQPSSLYEALVLLALEERLGNLPDTFTLSNGWKPSVVVRNGFAQINEGITVRVFPDGSYKMVDCHSVFNGSDFTDVAVDLDIDPLDEVGVWRYWRQNWRDFIQGSLYKNCEFREVGQGYAAYAVPGKYEWEATLTARPINARVPEQWKLLYAHWPQGYDFYVLPRKIRLGIMRAHWFRKVLAWYNESGGRGI